MSFGYGEVICPRCYEGEREFIFLDNSFFLNRLLTIFSRHKFTNRLDEGIEDVLLGQDVGFPDQDIVHEN